MNVKRTWNDPKMIINFLASAESEIENEKRFVRNAELNEEKRVKNGDNISIGVGGSAANMNGNWNSTEIGFATIVMLFAGNSRLQTGKQNSVRAKTKQINAIIFGMVYAHLLAFRNNEWSHRLLSHMYRYSLYENESSMLELEYESCVFVRSLFCFHVFSTENCALFDLSDRYAFSNGNVNEQSRISCVIYYTRNNKYAGWDMSRFIN